MNRFKFSILICFLLFVNNNMQAQAPCWFTQPPICNNSNFVYVAGMGTGNAEKIRNLAEAEALKRYVAEVRGVQLADATFREIVEKGVENAKIEGIPIQYRVVRQVFDNNNYYILLLLPRHFSADPRNIIYPVEELCDPRVGITKTAEPTKIGGSFSLNVSSTKFSDLEIVTTTGGNLTLSFETFSQCTWFALFNEDGVSFIPTRKDIVSEGNPYCSHPGGGFSVGGGGVGGGVTFNYNDKVQYCAWNPTVEKFKGSFTFKLDAGTYYLRILRGQTGLSNVNLSTNFQALK